MRRGDRHQQLLRAMDLEIKSDSRTWAKHCAEFNKENDRHQLIFDCIDIVIQDTDEYIEALQKGNIKNKLFDEPSAGSKALDKLKRKLGVKRWDEYFAENDKIE